MTAWHVIRLQNGLGIHAQDWDALNNRLFDGNALLTSRFVDTLLKHFSRGDEHLCVLHTDEIVAGMCIVRPQRASVWTTFLPSQAQIGPALLDGPSKLGDLIRALPGFVMQLDMLCNDPAFGNLMVNASRLSTSVDHAVTINVSLQDSFEAYWDARPKQLKKNAKRWERRLVDDGMCPEFRVIERPDEIVLAVERYGLLETRGWKGRIGTALDIESRQRSFYAQLLEQGSRKGKAFVFEMWLGDAIAASRLVIMNGGMVVILKTTYDESLQHYAPGRLLLKEVIRQAFRRWPNKTIEFYTNANADQLSWATGQRSIRHVTYFRNAFVAATAKCARTVRAKVKVKVKISALSANLSVDAYHHPDELPADVQVLFAEAEKSSVDLGLPWYRNFVSAVARLEPGVRFYVLRLEGRPIAALPVVVRPSRMPLHRRIESLANYYTALFAPALGSSVTGAQMAILFRSINKSCSPVSSWRLEPMDPRSSAFATIFDGLRLAGLCPSASFCFGNWFLRVDRSWTDYFLGRPSQVRNTIRRMERKLVSSSGHIEIIRDREALDVGIEAYQRVYAASWKREEPFPDFIPGLINVCVDHGWLRLGIVWLHERPIAAQLWIVAHGKASIYKLAYDAAYKAYSPGTVLTAYLMRHVFEHEQVKEVDYLIGDDNYKRNWMSDRRERWCIVAYNPRTPGGLFGMSRDVLARHMKSFLAPINDGAGNRCVPRDLHLRGVDLNDGKRQPDSPAESTTRADAH